MRIPVLINVALMASVLVLSAVLGRPAFASWREEQRLSRIETLEQMDTRDFAGARKVLRPGERTLYFMFSPECVFSDSAAAEWSQALARQTPDFKVVGLVYDIDAERDVRAFLDRHDLRIDVARVAYPELKKVTRVGMVPAAIFADASGALRYVGQGRNLAAPDSVLAALGRGGRR